MPRGFVFPTRSAAFWKPTRFAEDAFIDRSNNYLRVIARLRPGATFATAQAQMRLVAAQLEPAWPKENQHVGASVGTLRDELSPRSRLLLPALLAAAPCWPLTPSTYLPNLLLPPPPPPP